MGSGRSCNLYSSLIAIESINITSLSRQYQCLVLVSKSITHKKTHIFVNKTGSQPVSRPVELVHFSYFSVTNWKKGRKRKESAKITHKNMHRRGVYRLLGTFMMERDKKSCFCFKNDFDQSTACGALVKIHNTYSLTKSTSLSFKTLKILVEARRGVVQKSPFQKSNITFYK